MCNYIVHISYSAPYHIIKLRSYEDLNRSSNKGRIYIDDYAYGLPKDVHLEEGYHIIYYIPELEYNFSSWKLTGSIEFLAPNTELDNPTAIFISGSGELSVYYTEGLGLHVFRVSPADYSIFADSPIDLEVKVMALGKPVKNAEVTFYIDSKPIGSAVTDDDGYASYSFVPDEEKRYTWYAMAKKSGFATGSTKEWHFSFTKIKLDPSDNEIVTELPVNLVALVELDGNPVEDAIVSYFIDDNYVDDGKTQANGYSTYSTRDLTAGLHTWHVSVKIPGYDPIISETQNITYIPQLSVSLEYPKNDEVITNFTSTIELLALVTSDYKPIQGVNVSFFMMESYIGYNTSDVDGFTSLYFCPPKEDKTYHWYVAASHIYYFNDTSPTWSFYYPVQLPYVEVDEIFTSKSRADIDSEQTIGFHLRWENGSDVRGAAIRITDNHEGITDDLGWALFTVSNSDVGGNVWKIKDISCRGMGEFRHNFKYPKIVWDRISIELGLDNKRIDVGSNIELKVNAFYEYDNADFNGSIFYDKELYSDVVCEKTIKVKSIQDKKHGLSEFKSNEIPVIWDRVILSLDVPHERVEVGSKAEIICNGIYEYDRKPFKGSVTFDNDLKQNTLGEKNFSVLSISDPLYNLSVFEFNEVSCIFDDIEIEQQTGTVIPTQVQILTTIHYKFDHKPVEYAQVKVNGLGEYIGSGKYKTTLYTFNPFLQLNTEIKIEDWKTQVIEKNIYPLGNIISEASLLTIISGISARVLTNKTKRSKARSSL